MPWLSKLPTVCWDVFSMGTIMCLLTLVKWKFDFWATRFLIKDVNFYWNTFNIFQNHSAWIVFKCKTVQNNINNCQTHLIALFSKATEITKDNANKRLKFGSNFYYLIHSIHLKTVEFRFVNWVQYLFVSMNSCFPLPSQLIIDFKIINWRCWFCANHL